MNKNIEEYLFELSKNGFKNKSNSYLLIKKGVRFLMEKPININERYIAMRYYFISTHKQKEVTGYIYMNDLDSFQSALKRLLERFDGYEKQQNQLHKDTFQKIYNLTDAG